LDTVPPYFPATVDREKGMIHGRGACDTKSILAAMLVVAQRLVAEGRADGLGLLLVVSEETDHTGALAVVAEVGLPVRTSQLSGIHAPCTSQG
jgi:acetylornithine deacetylase